MGISDLRISPPHDNNYEATFRFMSEAANHINELYRLRNIDRKAFSSSFSDGLLFNLLNPTRGDIITAQDSAPTTWKKLSLGDTGFILKSDGTDISWVANDRLMAPDGSPNPALIVDDDGNIGVGIEVPESLLHLYTDQASGIRLQRHTTNASVWDWIPGYLSEGDLALRLIDGDTDPVHWYSNSNGFIGINETDPQANIHIKGAAWSYSPACGVLVQSIDGGVENDTAPSVQFVDKSWSEGSTTSAIGLASYDGAWATTSTLGDIIIRSVTGGIGFASYDSGDNHTLRMYMSHDGDFGIGTETPLANLHVLHDTAQSNRHLAVDVGLLLEGEEGRLQIVSEDELTEGSSIFLTNTPTSGDNKHWFLKHKGPTATNANSFQIGYTTSAATDVTFEDDTPILSVSTDGKLGINKISPEYALHIFEGGMCLEGNAKSILNGSTSSGREILELRVKEDIANGAGINLYGNSDSTYAGNIRMWTNNTERLRVDNDGYVTIYSISAATTDTDKFIVSDSGIIKYRTGAEVLSDIGAAPVIHTHSKLVASDGDPDPALMVDEDGQIGIGTTNPGYGIDMQHPTGASINVENTGDDTSLIRLDGNRTNSGSLLGAVWGYWDGASVAAMAFVTGDDSINKDNGQIRLYTSDGTPDERLRITEAGQVFLYVIDHETTDVDKFIVSNAGELKYRTGAELLTDISPTLYLISKYDDWDDAIATIGATKATLIIDEDTEVTNLDEVPETTTLKFINGAKLTGSGKSITINRLDHSATWQIFGDGLTVTFGSGAVTYAIPQWTGTTGDGATNDTANLQKIFNSGVSHIKIPAGTYMITGEIGEYITPAEGQTIEFLAGATIKVIAHDRNYHTALLLQYNGGSTGMLLEESFYVLR